MKKIPTIFKRNGPSMAISEDINENCQWVFDGEGIATRKYDGTCVKIEKGKYYKRREVKRGKQIPQGFIEEDFDETTGKRFGWIEVDPSDKANKWHMEAFCDAYPNGTYELIGPKIQGNPEGAHGHVLISHNEAEVYDDAPRSFDSLRSWFIGKDIEGLVFHHPDGRMAKIKKRDFSLDRKQAAKPEGGDAE